MANKISDETIEYVGILAKLELSEKEKEQYIQTMYSNIEGYYSFLEKRYKESPDTRFRCIEDR